MKDELFPEEFFAALAQVPVVNRYADFSNSAAAHRAQQRSVNRRNYQSGDSRKLVDWRTSARREGLVVQPLQDADSPNLLICLDRSESVIAEARDRDYAQLRLSLAFALRGLNVGSKVHVIAGDQSIQLDSIGQLPLFQEFLKSVFLNKDLRSDVDFSIAPHCSFDEIIVLSDPWVNPSNYSSAAVLAKHLRCLLLFTNRELNLPKQKLELQCVETGEKQLVDFSQTSPQQQLNSFVERQEQVLTRMAFETSHIECPSFQQSTQLINLSREHLLR